MIEVPTMLFVSFCILSMVLVFIIIFGSVSELKEYIQIKNQKQRYVHRRIDDIFSECLCCYKKIQKVDDKLDQILDFINDNECTVKDDD